MSKEKTPKRNITNEASGELDIVLVFAVFILTAFGLIMLYSSSSYSAQITFGSSVYYVKRQAAFACGGFIIMYIVSRIPTLVWKKFGVYLFLISLGMIFLVLSPLGVSSGGASRWISLGGFTLQPSEVVKITMAMFMASLICRFLRRMEDWRVYVLLYVPCSIAAGCVVIITNDLGTAVIIIVIGLVMMSISAHKPRHVWASLAVVILFGVLFILLKGYRMERIQAWLNIAEYADTTGYQILQGLYAIGSGGLFGKFLGNGTQKLYVPEVENDMIFSAICEELGIIGAILLIIIYIFIIWRMIKIFERTNDIYGRLMVAGISAHIGSQTLVNMAVVTNLMPNTGVPLPFISYGGSSIIILLFEIGIVLRVGRMERVVSAVEPPIDFERSQSVAYADSPASALDTNVLAKEDDTAVHGIRSWNNRYNRNK